MKHFRSKYQPMIDPTGRIGEDEPVFLLRAKDMIAPDTLRFWAFTLRAKGGDERMAAGILRWANTFERWQEQNGCKLPDLDPDETLADEGPIAGMTLEAGDPVKIGPDGKVWHADTVFSMDFGHKGEEPVVHGFVKPAMAAVGNTLFSGVSLQTESPKSVPMNDPSGNVDPNGTVYDKQKALDVLNEIRQSDSSDEQIDEFNKALAEYNRTLEEMLKDFGIDSKSVVVVVERKKKKKKNKKQ